MTRAQVLSLLNAHREEMQKRFAVKHLALFGSAARDEMREGSDIDVLVAFEGAPTFDGYMDLKFYLESLLGTGIDLVTEGAVKPRMWTLIEKELINVA